MRCLERSFDEFFQQAIKHVPYDYQRRLADMQEWPLAIHVGTGCGKTAAAVLVWAWKRRFASESVARQTPRRLIYCLPQRSLVQQIARKVHEWLLALEMSEDCTPNGIGVHVLMGGNVSNDWDSHPEKDMILIGTQDQLLSRALNRSYGLSRYRWPMHYGLVNSDSLWIIDEPQLFSSGLATTAQLQAFRQMFGTYGPAQTVWMSATFRRQWLETVDFRDSARTRPVLELSEADESALAERIHASKRLALADFSFDSSAQAKPKEYIKSLADLVRQVHRPGTMTLVILNRVKRAQDLYMALERDKPAEQLLLVHSRFRHADRDNLNSALKSVETRDTIIVATQAVEAGIDISARTLITELAPWPSLTQRFGRCNRGGELQDGDIIWIDQDVDSTEALPYQPEELLRARRIVQSLDNARIATLPPVEEQVIHRQVLRKRDLLALFDTTPDLTGMDIDVSPYIRDADDTDVLVFWRAWEGDRPDSVEDDASAHEICRVGISSFKEALAKKRDARTRQAWTWDVLNGRWKLVQAEYVCPGQVYLLHAQSGGYLPNLGFSTDSWSTVPVIEFPTPTPLPAHDLNNDNRRNEAEHRVPVVLSTHLLDVEREAARLVDTFQDIPAIELLVKAALWHDRGKAHSKFQTMLRSTLPADHPMQSLLLAKGGGGKAEKPLGAKGFRHELASALAYLQSVDGWTVNELPTRLIAYLIASHHGKVRMSIRSVPLEAKPATDVLYARGVQDGDELPEVVFSDGRRMEPVKLDLGPMRSTKQRLQDGVAVQSWLDGTTSLLEHYGPFRLAFWEMLLRVADWRASEKEDEKDAQ